MTKNDLKLAFEVGEMLAAAAAQCLFKVNGLCWSRCKAREFCEPEHHGLKTVENI